METQEKNQGSKKNNNEELEEVSEQKEVSKETNQEDQATSEEENEEVEGQEISLEELVLSLKEQNEDMQDKLLRQMAESENIRTRSQKSLTEAREYAIFAFAKDLVSVMDNLSMALAHLPEEMDDKTKNVIEGVKMTKSELASVFFKNALEIIEPKTGDKFDYNLHHAISQVESADHAAGQIVGSMQAGYKIKDRLIRPASVAVAK